MKRIASYILKFRKVILIGMALCVALGAVGLLEIVKQGKINSDMLAYINEGFTTYDGLNFLKENFNINGDAMLAVEAEEGDPGLYDIVSGFADIPGVTQLIWYGTVDEMEQMVTDMWPLVGPTMGMDSVDEFLTLADFRSFLRRPSEREGYCYYVVMMMVEYSSSTDAAFDILDQMEQRLWQGGYTTTSTAGMTSIARMVMRDTLGEMPKYLIFGFLAVLAILLLTTTSFVEPFLLIFTLVIAVIVNLGSTYFYPDVSIISFAASSVLQLGVTMDYAIFYMHVYKENRLKEDPFTATRSAAPRVWPSILASSLTTIGGFAALYCMRYGIGADLANVVVKGVALSLLTVVIVQPCLCVALDAVLKKTAHKRVIRLKYEKLGAFCVKHRAVLLLLAALLVVPSFIGQRSVPYSYFQIYDTMQHTTGVDGVANELTNQFLVAVPLHPKEGKTQADFIRDVEELDKVRAALGAFKAMRIDEDRLEALLDLNEVLVQNGGDSMLGSYVDSFFRRVPTPSGQAQWYTLYTIGITGSSEDAASFETYAQLEELLEAYFDESYELGMLTGVHDMSSITPTDFTNVSLVSVAVILFVVILMMRSLKKGSMMVVLIELGIWLNLSITALFGEKINFLVYILISSVQLGCTIDYAILLAGKFKEQRALGVEPKQAAVNAVSAGASAVVTSASIIVATTMAVFLVSTNSIVQDMASLLARGGAISLVLVLLVMPGLLVLSEKRWLPAPVYAWCNRRLPAPLCRALHIAPPPAAPSNDPAAVAEPEQPVQRAAADLAEPEEPTQQTAADLAAEQPTQQAAADLAAEQPAQQTAADIATEQPAQHAAAADADESAPGDPPEA